MNMGTMVYPIKVWLIKWFLWSCFIMDNFWFTRNQRWLNSGAEKYKNGNTNLCHFMRTLLIGNLTFFAVVALYVYGLYVFLVLPFIVFSTDSILSVVEFIACLAAGSVAIGGIGYLLIKGTGKVFGMIGDMIETNYKPEVQDKPKETGFFVLIWNYVVAFKHNICPILTWNLNPEPTQTEEHTDA